MNFWVGRRGECVKRFAFLPIRNGSCHVSLFIVLLYFIYLFYHLFTKVKFVAAGVWHFMENWELFVVVEIIVLEKCHTHTQ